MENGITKVRFDLWAVLAFLTLLGGICIGYLFNAQMISRDERKAMDQALDIRVSRIEVNYGFIVEGIGELKQGQLKVIDELAKHEKNHAIMRRWQDVPASR